MSVRYLNINVSSVERLNAGLNALHKDVRNKVVVRAINRVGDMAYTQTLRVIGRETGVRRSELVKEISKHPAGAVRPAYVIKATGGPWSLKRFGPRPVRDGVTAAPWRKRRLYAHAFIGPGGHVYWRAGTSRLPIIKLATPGAPAEMMRDVVIAQLNALVVAKLPERLLYETQRAIARMKKDYGL